MVFERLVKAGDELDSPLISLFLFCANNLKHPPNSNSHCVTRKNFTMFGTRLIVLNVLTEEMKTCFYVHFFEITGSFFLFFLFTFIEEEKTIN